MKKTFISIISAALALAACSEQNLAPEAAQATFKAPVISATMQQLQAADGTKVNFKDASDNDFSVIWELGDQIKVFNKAGQGMYVVYKVVSISQDGRASFEIDHEFTDADGKKMDDLSVFDPESNVYYAHFGVIDNVKYGTLNEDGTVKTARVSTATIDPGKINKEFHNCVAKATLADDGSLNFDFMPTICYFMISFPEELEEGFTTPGKILVLGSSSAKASAAFDVTFTDGGLSFGNLTGGNANAAYHHSDNGAKANFLKGKTYFLPVRAGFTTAGMKMGPTIGSTYTVTLNADKHKIATQPGKIYDLGTCCPVPTE